MGQFPGQEDMKNGVPFSGPQGIVCKEFLERAGFLPQDLFFTNVLLCFCPAGNPPPQSIKNCADQVDDVISVVQPQMIVTLGAVAADRLKPRLGKAQLPEYRGIVVFPAPHPAAIARVKSKEEKKRIADEVEMVLDRARRHLDEMRSH